ncbi:MAG: histidine phosphatase family protein [Phototrophicales bacterium]
MSLILIKHAMPKIDPQHASAMWELGRDGINGSKIFGQKLKTRHVTRIITSHEKKAIQTGMIAAQVLGVPCVARDYLHEHDRRGVPYYDRDTFYKMVKRFFDVPDQLVFGHETADAARQRFETAVKAALTEFPEDRLAIVAHGTVITLFVGKYNQQIRLFEFWKQLDLPSMVILSQPYFKIQAVHSPIVTTS